ncbi:MAG: outer membrane protein assembly factor BamB [Pseudoalteromonas tetraodonis]|jgi:outer membrane protein assembly factor BamB
MKLTHFFVLAFAIWTSIARADEGNISWRFDGAGRYPNIQPPTEWRSDKNVLWKTPVKAGGYSSPIVAGGKVFVTAEMGSLICLDLADGQILWEKDLFGEGSKDIPANLSKQLLRGCGGESKESTPTPTSNGKLVFYINAMGLCACYDLEGKQKWIRIIETAEDEEFFSASPIFVGDKIILSWGCLIALDSKDGRTLWKAEKAKPTHATPAITKIGGEQVAITPAGDIVRLADGEILCSGLFESTFTTPLVEGNALYVIDADSIALALPAKAQMGMRLKELWKTELGGIFMASPAHHAGLIYTIESRTGLLHLLDRKTGEILNGRGVVLDKKPKKEKLETGSRIEGLAIAQQIYASATIAKGGIYLFDDAGGAALLEHGRDPKLIRINQLKDACIGTPYFVGNKIIARGVKTVYCLSEDP